MTEYRYNTYTWIVKIPGESKRMKVVVNAKDEEEARNKAKARINASLGNEDLLLVDELLIGQGWINAFNEQINGSPVMVMKGNSDVSVSFFSP